MTSIQIELTTRCNHRCIMCSRCNDIYDMNLRTAHNICKLLPSIDHIQIAGKGEPLLHPYISDIIDIFTDNNITLTLVTNGSIKYESWYLFNEIIMSVHDTDAYRYNIITGGDINDVIPNIPHSDLVYNVISSINGPYMQQIIQDEYKYGASHIFSVPVKDWFITGPLMDTSKLKYDTDVSLPLSWSDPPGARRIFISASGGVVPWCSKLDPNAYVCGNINIDNIADILNNIEHCSFRRQA